MRHYTKHNAVVYPTAVFHRTKGNTELYSVAAHGNREAEDSDT